MIDGQGRILTNYHVVEGSSKTTVTLKNEKTYDAKIVGTDPSNDVAVLKINAPSNELHPLPLGDSSKLAVGQPVVAIGNPLGYSGSESTGIVSGLGRDIPAPNGFTIPGAIQTDAPITNGNSGGPLIDSSGRVIGINSQVAANQNGTGQAEGIGFAVPINTAKSSVGQLDRTGEIKQPYLGIQGYGITPEMADSFDTKKGVAIARVSPGGPADSAGLKGGGRTVDAGGASFIVGGDVITAVDGTPVKDMGDLQKAISKDKVGQKVSLEVQRGSQTTGVQVTLGERPATAQG
jgi:S1-C subfamily serine protease